jgi:hypothetical protein
MECRKQPDSSHQRPASKNRHIYYIELRDETGEYRTAVSSARSRRDDAVR